MEVNTYGFGRRVLAASNVLLTFLVDEILKIDVNKVEDCDCQ